MADKPVAIVTGASRGIGKAIAKELASLGYDLVVNYFDLDADGGADDSFALRARKEVEQAPARCEVLRGDISSSDDRAKLVGFAKEKFGRCDMLVNNAGVAPQKRVDLLQATEQSYDRVMGINLNGPYFLSQSVAK